MKIPENLKESKESELRFATWTKQTIDIVSPKDLILLGGRGIAKTSDIVAERTMDIVYDMPRAYTAFVADTYDNAVRNTAPTMIEGWMRKGWKEGVHYVTDERPPKNWAKPYKTPMTFKHTISTWNGHFINVGSLAQPTSLAGNSYQHFVIDEGKNCNFDKLKKLFPAKRGDFTEFGHSPFFLGITVTSDMPRIGDGEHDWMLAYEKNMEIERVLAALQAGLELNDIKIKLVKARKTRNRARIESLTNRYKIWYELWVRSRMGITLFLTVSSFANNEILRKVYFEEALISLGTEEFKSAILSLKNELKAGEKFYLNLGSHHFYDDGILMKYYDQFKLTDTITESSQSLRLLQDDMPIDGGMDFGKQCSLVIGQRKHRYYYILKDFHTLAPQSSKELAKKFVDFFKNHSTKVLNLYYDRSGNQYASNGRDWANEIKDHIEKYDGFSTGWHVNLMSLNQRTISQEQEYTFAKKLFGEYYPDLPKIKIDKHQCSFLKSSLELTKIKMGKDRNGSPKLEKDKSTEKKLPLNKLPLYSTNFSDAFKYLIYREEWISIADRQTVSADIDPGVY